MLRSTPRQRASVGIGTWFIAAGVGVVIGATIAWVLIGIGATVILSAVLDTKPMQQRLPWTSRLPFVTSVLDNEFHPDELLANELQAEIEHARRMLNTIRSGYSFGLFAPDTTALDKEVSDISVEAMHWSESIADRLRPQRPDRAFVFEAPEELDPEDTMAHHVEEMLVHRTDELDRIIRHLRREEDSR